MTGEFKTREFWQTESRNYLKPHYRLQKCARIINRLSKGKICDLLDVGCGPAVIAELLDKNIHYYGIDLVIQVPAPNLIEIDIVQNVIGFDNKKFDFVLMQGVFEYLGNVQRKKFSEIQHILKPQGKFIVTYVNFHHFHPNPQNTFVYNNIQPIQSFKSDLDFFFKIDRWFPTSYNRNQFEPKRSWIKKIQMPLNIRIPGLSTKLAVEYIFICSNKRSNS